MKKQALKALSNKSNEELEKMAEQKAKEIVQKRTDLKIGQLKNVREVKSLRLDFTQIKTILRQDKLNKEDAI